MRFLFVVSLGALSVVGCSDDDSAAAQACSNCPVEDAGDGAAGNSGSDAKADSTPDAAKDATPDAPGEGGTDATAADCLTHAAGVSVAETDLDGYPPYALDGCSMAYVSSTGELLLRDLKTGGEQQIAAASESPRRPSLAGAVLAWEADVAGKSVIRVRSGGAVETVAGGFDHAREPKATSDAVVLTGFSGPANTSDSDVFLYDIAGKSIAKLSTLKGQQRFADVSATHVAWSDFSEDPSGIYSGDGTSLADVVLYERSSKKAQTIKLSGKQAFPMLAVTGRVGFLDWLAVHPVPKLQDYRILSLPLGDLTAKPAQVASVQSEAAVRPSANDNRVEWVVRWGGQSTLHRAPLDGSAAPTIVPLGGVAEVHAPAGTSTLSVVATRAKPNAMPTLQAVAVP